MTNPRSKARIEARIHERVAYCIEFELNDPRTAFITVTKTEVSSDLSTARIFYSVYGSKGDKTKASHMLADATGFVRKQVGRVLKTRRIPRLIWVYDDSIEIAENMDRAITKALDHDRSINPEAHTDVSPEEKEPEAETEREYLDFLNAQEEEGLS